MNILHGRRLRRRIHLVLAAISSVMVVVRRLLKYLFYHNIFAISNGN